LKSSVVCYVVLLFAALASDEACLHKPLKDKGGKGPTQSLAGHDDDAALNLGSLSYTCMSMRRRQTAFSPARAAGPRRIAFGFRINNLTGRRRRRDGMALLDTRVKRL